MSRIFSSQWRDRTSAECYDPFPVHTLKRVDRPTTSISDHLVQRTDQREHGFARAGRGDFGPFLAGEFKRFVPKHPLSRSLGIMSVMLGRLVDGVGRLPVDGEGLISRDLSYSGKATPSMNPTAAMKAPGTDDPHYMARHIKETAYFLRSDAVGICELPPYSVYSHSSSDGKPINLPHKHAIAILVDQDWRTAKGFSGNDWISNSMSFLSYSTSGFIACILADYIRNLGYSARAHHALNYQVVVPPILLWAGLGEMSRIGDVVINPFLGPRFKAAIVTTDLPLSVDKPIDFGLQDFCDKCKKCARECPSSAICNGGKVIYNGYEKWPIDVEKCTSMRVGNQKGSGCGTCIKVCPWNKPYTPFHRMINWTMRNVPPVRNMAIWGDDLMGYGKPDRTAKWWLDLENVNGELRVPDNSVDRYR